MSGEGGEGMTCGKTVRESTEGVGGAEVLWVGGSVCVGGEGVLVGEAWGVEGGLGGDWWFGCSFARKNGEHKRVEKARGSGWLCFPHLVPLALGEGLVPFLWGRLISLAWEGGCLEAGAVLLLASLAGPALQKLA